MRRRPTGNDRLTAVTDGGGRRAAMMGGSDGPWLERIDGRGRWTMRRASRHTEETGGCGRRTLGVMMGGGPADVAGFHHRSTFIGSFGHRWMDEERECWRRSAQSQGCVAVSANTNLWRVGLPGSGSNFCGSPQRKVPGSGIGRLGCTSGCYQALRSTVPGLQSDQAQALWEKATVRSLLTTD